MFDIKVTRFRRFQQYYTLGGKSQRATTNRNAVRMKCKIAVRDSRKGSQPEVGRRFLRRLPKV